MMVVLNEINNGLVTVWRWILRKKMSRRYLQERHLGTLSFWFDEDRLTKSCFNQRRSPTGKRYKCNNDACM